MAQLVTRLRELVEGRRRAEIGRAIAEEPW
jgi:hypothetical protein